MIRVRAATLGGYTAILASSLLYGTYGLWSRLMGATFPPFAQAWVRSLIIAVVMSPAAFEGPRWRWRLRRVARADRWQVGVYLLFCVFTQVPIYYAFNNAPVGAVQLIFYAVFIITAYTVAGVYLKERLTCVKLAAMALVFVGLALVFGAGLLSFAPLGLVLAAGAGVASGAEMSSTKQISQKYPPAYLVLLGWVATLVTHLPIAILLGEGVPTPRFDRAWLWLVLYALANAVAFWLSVKGFKAVDASIGSLLGATEVVFAVLVAAVVLRQEPSWLTVAGGIVIVVAALTPDLWQSTRTPGNARTSHKPTQPTAETIAPAAPLGVSATSSITSEPRV